MFLLLSSKELSRPRDRPLGRWVSLQGMHRGCALLTCFFIFTVLSLGHCAPSRKGTASWLFTGNIALSPSRLPLLCPGSL